MPIPGEYTKRKPQKVINNKVYHTEYLDKVYKVKKQMMEIKNEKKYTYEDISKIAKMNPSTIKKFMTPSYNIIPYSYTLEKYIEFIKLYK